MTKAEQYRRFPWLEKKEMSPEVVESYKDFYCDLETYTGMTTEYYDKQYLYPVNSQEGFFHDTNKGIVVYKYPFKDTYFLVSAEIVGGKYVKREKVVPDEPETPPEKPAAPKEKKAQK